MRKFAVPRLWRHGGVATMAIGALGACDFPTEAPILQPRFIVPGENTTLGVSQLLPSAVQLSVTAFTLSLNAGPTITRTLGEVCSACVLLNGQNVPKPAFSAVLPTSTVSLPTGVSNAAVTSGQVRINFTNGFGFDPIRPGPTNGSLRVRLFQGATTFADTLISGATTALPPGATTGLDINLRAGALAGPLTAEITLDSPAGATTRIDTSNTIAVTPTPQNIGISQATVSVTRNVTAAEVQLDLTDVSETVEEHLESGGFVVTITKPAGFTGVTGNLTLTILGAEGGNIVKSNAINLGVGTPQRIVFNRTELNRMFGQNVTVRITGPVTVTNTIVRPTDVVNITTRLEILITTASN